MPTDSGIDFVTKIPKLSEKSDIQKALQDFLYGDVSNKDAAIGTLTNTDGSHGLAGHLNSRFMRPNVDYGDSLNMTIESLNVTDSTSSSTGALTLSGGMGTKSLAVAKDIYHRDGYKVPRVLHGHVEQYFGTGYSMAAGSIVVDQMIYFDPPFSDTPSIVASPRDVWGGHETHVWRALWVTSSSARIVTYALDSVTMSSNRTFGGNWIAVGSY